MQVHVSCTLLFKGSKKYIDILKKKSSNEALISQYSAKHCIWIGLGQKSKES